MWFLGAILTSFCFGINNAIFKWSTGRGYSKVSVQFFFYLSAFSLTSLYGLITETLHFTPITILLGVIIGVLNTNGNIQMSKAFEKGPASLTAPIISANAIFPVLSAGLIFHEEISTVQWIGILLILSSVVAIQYTPKQTKGETNYMTWMFRIILATLSFGVLGVLMKYSTYLGIDTLTIIVSMYAGGCVYLLLLLIRNQEIVTVREGRLGALVGCISIIGYTSYFYAVKTGIASIVFPIVSLNCLIVVLVGCTLYKETLRTYQMVGVLSALIGIVLTKL